MGKGKRKARAGMVLMVAVGGKERRGMVVAKVAVVKGVVVKVVLKQ